MSGGLGDGYGGKSSYTWRVNKRQTCVISLHSDRNMKPGKDFKHGNDIFSF